MYNAEVHEKAAEIAKRMMYEGRAIVIQGRPMDVTWFEATLQGLQAIIPFKVEWLNEACMGLGAGFSGQGEICGHVSAGVVAIGLDILSMAPEIGRDTVMMRKEIQRNTRRFCRAFKQEFNGLSCRQLVGVDNLLDPELFRKAMQEGGMSRCFDFQRWVTIFPLPSERASGVVPSLEELRGATAGGTGQT